MMQNVIRSDITIKTYQSYQGNKELMYELRKELRVSNEEHKELLGKVNANTALRKIRCDLWLFVSELLVH